MPLRRTSPTCCRSGVGRRGRLVLGIVLPLLSQAAGALAQTTPKILPPLAGDGTSKALAINNRGETVGISGEAGAGLTFDDGRTAIL